MTRKSVNLDEEAHRTLIRAKGLHESFTGTQISISDFITHLSEQELLKWEDIEKDQREAVRFVMDVVYTLIDEGYMETAEEVMRCLHNIPIEDTTVENIASEIDRALNNANAGGEERKLVGKIAQRVGIRKAVESITNPE